MQLAIGSLLTLGGRCNPWGRDCSNLCLPALAVASLPLYLQEQGRASTQPAGSPLVFAQSFVLCMGQAAG